MLNIANDIFYEDNRLDLIQIFTLRLFFYFNDIQNLCGTVKLCEKTLDKIYSSLTGIKLQKKCKTDVCKSTLQVHKKKKKLK